MGAVKYPQDLVPPGESRSVWSPLGVVAQTSRARRRLSSTA